MKIGICIVKNKKSDISENLKYINRLTLPDGFETEIIEKKCDEREPIKADFWLCLTENMYVFDKDILVKAVRIFNKNEDIAILGATGLEELGKNCRWKESVREGAFALFNGREAERYGSTPVEGDYEAGSICDVCVAGGLIMIRGDAFNDITYTGDLYNVFSVCAKAKRDGKRVCVLKQNAPIVMYEGEEEFCDENEELREAFLKENKDVLVYKKDEKPVSVVIPTYNRAYCIKQAVESVLNQTYKNIEVVVTDDGSTDNTEEVVSAIKDDRVRFVKMPQNGGPGAARNFGVENAKYDIIAFHDSDDIWRYEKLERQVKLMEAGGYDMVYGRYSYHYFLGSYDRINPACEIKMADKTENIYKTILKKNIIAMPTIVVKKELFEKAGGFNPQLKALEDYELCLRLTSLGKIGFLNEPVIDVYASRGSVSSDVNAYFYSRAYMVCIHVEKMIETGVYDDVLKDIYIRAQSIGVLEQIEEFMRQMLASCEKEIYYKKYQEIC